MAKRLNVYLNEETLQKFDEIKAYLDAEIGGSLNRQGNNSSAVVVKVIHTFHKLFLEGEQHSFSERLIRLEKNLTDAEDQKLLKSIRRQMDQLLYLELTNFHAITKGVDFDIQDLESVHSHFDPKQNELMARIDDILKEDISRGQAIKYSH
ncbi:hypothetical protein E5983_08770 [Streptococcus danieliae]|uniref:Uncharacterized protein n=1 Tax=Streptococcus danieliae TaxID=747656 RepID=A0A7X3G9P5_9STRE|nr:hypothetical protein [Streptococcus danieliae]MVX59715.1 hypothetical protein [Streptococcus danieliae]